MRRLISVVVMFLCAVTFGTAGLAVAAPGAEKPGELVSFTKLPPGWGGTDNGYEITYLTEDVAGGRAAARGLVFLPGGPAPEGGWPIVSWDHGTNGLGASCGLTSSNGAPYDSPLLRRLNEVGYAVVATDYLGLSKISAQVHPYQHLRTEATASIDIVRAARRAVPELSNDWAVFGVSQGGTAALATGNLAPSYAPELNFHGTAALAPGTQLDRMLPSFGPAVPNLGPINGVASIFAAVLSGMVSNPTGFDIHPYLTARGEQVLRDLSTRCVPEWADTLGSNSLGSLLARPLDTPEFQRFAHSYLATPVAGYRQPIFIGHGIRDLEAPLPLTLALLQQFDAAGTKYEFQTFDTDHQNVTKGASFEAAIAFLRRVLPAG
ncbi:lipase family protein [Nocardia sp. NPDC052566]|uniref:lipase family protein n=1 Tax=Nocardia sp. NPDC052566 TaxID=3364330 RepID=UPI0037CBA99C